MTDPAVPPALELIRQAGRDAADRADLDPYALRSAALATLSCEEWLAHGWQQGWCSPPVCAVHDGIPYSPEEDDAMDGGDDPCVHVLRLYETTEQRLAVEAEGGPVSWRASNRGWSRPS